MSRSQPAPGLPRVLWVCLVCASCWWGCQQSQAPEEPRYPWPMVRQMLDAEPAAAQEALFQVFPDSLRQEGSFARYQVTRSEVLDEVIFFRDVRSGRVNTVILKYKADLTPRDRAQALELFGGAGLAQRLEEEPAVELAQGPLRLRARAEDRLGRLTLTVEPSPEEGGLPQP